MKASEWLFDQLTDTANDYSHQNIFEDDIDDLLWGYNLKMGSDDAEIIQTLAGHYVNNHILHADMKVLIRDIGACLSTDYELPEAPEGLPFPDMESYLFGEAT